MPKASLLRFYSKISNMQPSKNEKLLKFTFQVRSFSFENYSYEIHIPCVYLVEGVVYGPRGMYCSYSANSDGLPTLVMHFAPERVSLTPVPVDIGGFKAYGLSANGEYATVDENRLGYVSVPEGSIAEPTVRTNVQLPTHYLIEHFSGAMGLQSEDLILMSYRSGHGIQVNTSNGPMVLTYDACQRSFTNVNFCAELEPHGTLVINAQRVGLSQELSIRADGKLVFVGQWLLDTDEVPMKISVSKSLDKHLDGLLDLMPKMIEASYEYFWSRGQALSWDPVRQRMTLSYGEWTTSYSGPTPPDVIFTPC